MEDGGSREVSRKEAGGVGQQPRSRVEDCEAEEGDRPHAVEDLEQLELVKSLIKIYVVVDSRVRRQCSTLLYYISLLSGL